MIPTMWHEFTDKSLMKITALVSAKHQTRRTC